MPFGPQSAFRRSSVGDLSTFGTPPSSSADPVLGLTMMMSLDVMIMVMRIAIMGMTIMRMMVMVMMIKGFKMIDSVEQVTQLTAPKPGVIFQCRVFIRSSCFFFV